MRDLLWLDFFTEQNPANNFSPNRRFQIWFGVPKPERDRGAFLQRKRWSEPQRAVFSGGAGGNPLRLFASGLSLRESLDPRPGQGRETTSQVITCDGPNGTAYRCRRAPGPTWQVSTCAGPNGTAYRYRPPPPHRRSLNRDLHVPALEGLGIPLQHRLDVLRQEALHLLRAAADVVRRVQALLDLLPGEAEGRVGGDAL